jgi:hypothetical protein
MVSDWHKTVEAAALYNVRDGSAIDLEMDSHIPSKVRHSFHNETASTAAPLSDSARDGNCASQTKNQESPARGIVS